MPSCELMPSMAMFKPSFSKESKLQERIEQIKNIRNLYPVRIQIRHRGRWAPAGETVQLRARSRRLNGCRSRLVCRADRRPGKRPALECARPQMALEHLSA